MRRRTALSLSGHLDCTPDSRPTNIAVGLLPLSVATCAALLRRTGLCLDELRNRLVPTGSLIQDFPAASSLNSRFRTNRIRFWRSCPPAALSSRSGRKRRADNHKTRCDLRHALDCGLAAVACRTLSQSARTARPFELPSACSIAGPPGRHNHCFQHDCGLPLACAIGSDNLAAPETKVTLSRNQCSPLQC